LQFFPAPKNSEGEVFLQWSWFVQIPLSEEPVVVYGCPDLLSYVFFSPSDAVVDEFHGFFGVDGFVPVRADAVVSHRRAVFETGILVSEFSYVAVGEVEKPREESSTVSFNA